MKIKKEKTTTISHAKLFYILANKKVATNYRPLSPNCQKKKGGKSLGHRWPTSPYCPLG
jgi:hypothetical protein